MIILESASLDDRDTTSLIKQTPFCFYFTTNGIFSIYDNQTYVKVNKESWIFTSVVVAISDGIHSPTHCLAFNTTGLYRFDLKSFVCTKLSNDNWGSVSAAISVADHKVNGNVLVIALCATGVFTVNPVTGKYVKVDKSSWSPGSIRAISYSTSNRTATILTTLGIYNFSTVDYSYKKLSKSTSWLTARVGIDYDENHLLLLTSLGTFKVSKFNGEHNKVSSDAWPLARGIQHHSNGQILVIQSDKTYVLDPKTLQVSDFGYETWFTLTAVCNLSGVAWNYITD
ncbi:hypothetical protein HDV02_001260 [Globomyces sp. JEL0801]|nr:hypothetical protein HDV02_001260 [Globomyces sp. JEL0801]